jgi:hypothetical protein
MARPPPPTGIRGVPFDARLSQNARQPAVFQAGCALPKLSVCQHQPTVQPCHNGGVGSTATAAGQTPNGYVLP